MTVIIEEILKDEDETVAVGTRLGSLLFSGLTLFLEGQLGAGKTTLTRGVLNSLGHSGAVKSPTYTLVEPYEALRVTAYHFDLYRLGDPEELAYLGIRDYFHDNAICIVEWPVNGLGFLPEADIQLELQPQALETVLVECASAQKSTLDTQDVKISNTRLIGRKLTITAITEKGKHVLGHW